MAQQSGEQKTATDRAPRHRGRTGGTPSPISTHSADSTSPAQVVLPDHERPARSAPDRRSAGRNASLPRCRDRNACRRRPHFRGLRTPSQVPRWTPIDELPGPPPRRTLRAELELVAPPLTPTEGGQCLGVLLDCQETPGTARPRARPPRPARPLVLPVAQAESAHRLRILLARSGSVRSSTSSSARLHAAKLASPSPTRSLARATRSNRSSSPSTAVGVTAVDLRPQPRRPA